MDFANQDGERFFQQAKLVFHKKNLEAVEGKEPHAKFLM